MVYDAQILFHVYIDLQYLLRGWTKMNINKKKKRRTIYIQLTALQTLLRKYKDILERKRVTFVRETSYLLKTDNNPLSYVHT